MSEKEKPHKVYSQNAVFTNQNILKKLAVGQKTSQGWFYLSAHRFKSVIHCLAKRIAHKSPGVSK